jgi:putative transposase
VLVHPFNWKRASMAAALCYGVRVAALCYGVGGGGASLCFHVQAGNYDTDSLIGVLGELRRFLGGEKATLLWDGLPAHRSAAMGRGSPAAILAGGRAAARLRARPQPGQGAVSSLKGGELANLTGPTLAQVIAQAHRGIQRVRQTAYLAFGFLRHAGLSVACHIHPTRWPCGTAA